MRTWMNVRRPWLRFSVPLLLVVLGAFQVAPLQAHDSNVLLRYRFKAGQQFSYLVEAHSTRFVLGNVPGPIELAEQVHFAITSKGVNRDGSLRLSLHSQGTSI